MDRDRADFSLEEADGNPAKGQMYLAIQHVLVVYAFERLRPWLIEPRCCLA